MPKGTAIITPPGSKLLLVGNQKGIAKAKRMIALTEKPEDL